MNYSRHSQPRNYSARPQRVIKNFDPSNLIRQGFSPAPEEAPTPVSTRTFADFGFEPRLYQNILAKKYVTPTPIQDQTMPLLMQGKDVVGLANTGTGKTAAFLLPLIHKVLQDKTQRVLILAPTRELAVQIEAEFAQFAMNTGLRSVVCIGGVYMGQQIYKLRLGPHFVIGTPGRIKDLTTQGVLRLGQFTHVVLDEVDRMLDMGFIRDMTAILSALPRTRQSAFFSATTTNEVQKIMNTFLHEPTVISIKTKSVLTNIHQETVSTHGKPKIDILHDLLIRQGFDKVVVFGRTKFGLEKLSRELAKRGFGVAAIHGNKTQGQRQRALQEFKSNRVKVLLATDVASRGLDIDNVTHVINYDLPESYEDYIHRIGRTGRAQKKGVALTLVEK